MAVLAYVVSFRTEWIAYIIQHHPWNKDSFSTLLYGWWCSSLSHTGCWLNRSRTQRLIITVMIFNNNSVFLSANGYEPTESPVIHTLCAVSFSLTNSSARSVNHPPLAISHIPYTQTKRVWISSACMFLYTTLENHLKQKLLHSWIDWLWRRMAEEIFWLPSWNGEKKSNSAAE